MILGLVGKGGMGEVFAAYDPELDRKIALKLLFVKPEAGMSHQEGRTRLLREAQAIAKLSHPNVVVVYDVGTYQDHVFIAMEFIEGHTVGYWLNVKHRAWRDVLRVFIAAGRGLAAAHEGGIVHRDLKPENVMIGNDGKVHVMDFGLARQVGDADTQDRLAATPAPVLLANAASGLLANDPEGGDLGSTRVIAPPVPVASPTKQPPLPRSTPSAAALKVSGSAAFSVELTQAGAVLGTPAYMAPEQMRGALADARSDQFSLCVALYEGLYGQRPFLGNSLPELSSNVLNGRVLAPPPGTKVPGWVHRALLRGLKVNPDERWPSLAALLDVLGHDPVQKRRRMALTAAAMLVPLVVGVMVARSRATTPPLCAAGGERAAEVWAPKGPQSAELARAFLGTKKAYASQAVAAVSQAFNQYIGDWARLYQDACEATHLRGEQSTEVLDLRMECLSERLGEMRALVKVFMEADGDVVQNAVSAANGLPPVNRCADVAVLKAVIKPPSNPEVQKKVSEIRQGLAAVRAQIDAGRGARMAPTAQQLETAAKVLNYPPLVAEATHQRGRAVHHAGGLKESVAIYEGALWTAEGARHDTLSSEILMALTFVAGYLQNNPAEGERWARHHDAVIRRMGSNPIHQAWLLGNLGLMAEAQGDSQRAAQLQASALALKRGALPPGHLDVAISQGNLAISLGKLGRRDEALAANQAALVDIKRSLGNEHPDVAVHSLNRGEILLGGGHVAEATAVYKQALELLEPELGKEHFVTAFGYHGLGEAALKAGKSREALPWLRRALTIREKADPDPARVAETRFVLAQSLWAVGDERRRALELAEQARACWAGLPGFAAMQAQAARWLRERI